MQIATPAGRRNENEKASSERKARASGIDDPARCPDVTLFADISFPPPSLAVNRRPEILRRIDVRYIAARYERIARTGRLARELCGASGKSVG